ncbi:MAG: Gfo/Idh/MocA family oxidoreductase [Myxococcota bacterium]|jgi:predicted dehydrogenase/threonine dehydrogenase-like Zn-dependent dehydrogenase|nr:Gfo/Idh/MocA family oxidoreductase [Myxococcota bacterium]
MKQILQSARSGALELVEVPAPTPAEGQVLVQNHFSVVSPGTEKMAMDFARKSLVGKARSRPDLVKQVVRKLQHEGPGPTYRAVTTRLEAPQPLGYASAGVVVAVGPGVDGFAPGNRVACAGAGYANHAELIVVPENLVVHVPRELELEKAAYATLGAIAMQGVRVADPRLGEVAAVIGLGLIGQIAVQLLRAAGCRVLAIDIDSRRVEEALEQGAAWGATPGDDHEAWMNQATEGFGADIALVTAASESSAPIQLAADLCRMKGRVACVGATAMDLDRRTFYDKELELRMSMSYGPGRYDRRYEELGLDYPISYVRWTENRNLQAFVELAAAGDIDPARLDAEIVDFADAEASYEALAKGERKNLAILFRYADSPDSSRSLSLAGDASQRTAKQGDLGIAFVGAGNYAKAQLLPAVGKVSGVGKVSIVTATGPSALRTCEKFGFANCGTNPQAVFDDANVDLVFVATQHDSHAQIAAEALRAGKAVWLEKPIGLDRESVRDLITTARETEGFLSVGYNRRFSPHLRAVADAFAGRREPLALQYTVAAGATPSGTWITDPKTGGGRIVGECCHFVDLAIALVGALPVSVHARALGRDPERDDSIITTIGFEDGSVATLQYLASASAELPKERFEASSQRTTVQCENFRTTRTIGGKSFKTVNQNKGQQDAVLAVIEACKSGAPSPFTLAELAANSETTFAILDSIRSGETIDVAARMADYAT